MEDEEGEGKVSLSVRGGGGGADGARTGHWGWVWARGVYQAARERENVFNSASNTAGRGMSLGLI